MDRADGELLSELIPRILRNLLVTQAETTILLVDLQYLYLDHLTNLDKLIGVLDLASPR